MEFEEVNIGVQEVVEQELETRTSGTDVLVWPFPNALVRDSFFPEVTEIEDIGTVYTAVGTGGKNLRGFHQSHEDVECLDYVLEESVLSSNIPDMIEQGILPKIGFEYARDVAMDLKYNEERSVEDIITDSYSMLGSEGFLVYDLHDFGPTGLYTHPEIEEEISGEEYTGIEKLNKSKCKHIEMFRRELNDAFPRVEAYTSRNSLRDSYFLASK